jgi:DNA-binding GntR family transcriptional regulator
MKPSRPGSAVSRVDEALAALRAAIEQRRLMPGEPLRLDALSHELQMSVQPIREAIRLLEAEGVVERSNNRGAVVAKVGLDEIIDLCCIRTLIEPTLTSLATLRATEAEVREIRAAHEHLRALLESSQPTNHIIQLTIDWHVMIYNAARSRYFSDFVERVWTAIRINSAWRSSHAANLVVEHEAILEGMEARDDQAAAAAMRAHVQESVVGHIEGYFGTNDPSTGSALARYEGLMRHMLPGGLDPAAISHT